MTVNFYRNGFFVFAYFALLQLISIFGIHPKWLTFLNDENYKMWGVSFVFAAAGLIPFIVLWCCKVNQYV
jgi:hypothetical protein